MPTPHLFEREFIQRLSYSTWRHVAVLPAIISIYIFLKIEQSESFNLLTTALLAAFGVLLFTFVEQVLHRFIFHAEWYLPDIRIIHMLHFFLHGIHHMIPNDPQIYFKLEASLCYHHPSPNNMRDGLPCLRQLQFSHPLQEALFWWGCLIGYVVHDSTHYFLHFLDTCRHQGTYFHRLQKYHNQHHCGGEHAGFGVSSKLWDVVFRSGRTEKRTQKTL